MTVTLDGRQMLTEAAIHAALKRELGLPDHYGANLDALWDCLTSDVSLPLTLRWDDFMVCRRSVGDYADRVLTVLRDAQDELDDFRVELEDVVEFNLTTLIEELEVQDLASHYPPDRLSFADEMAHIREYIDVGEYALAYELIIINLETVPFVVSGTAAVRLAELALVMGFKTTRPQDS